MWYRILLVVFILTHNNVSGCSIAGQPRKFSKDQVLEDAPVVLSGTDVYHAPEVNGRRNYTFNVSCVFKSGGLDIPRTIFLLDVGAITCHGSRMDPVGKSYIAALKVPSPEYIKDRGIGDDYFVKDSNTTYYFLMAERGELNSAAFDATAANLTSAANLCGMDKTFTNLGDGQPGDHQCPDRTVSIENCVSGATGTMAVKLSRFGLLELCLFVIVGKSAQTFFTIY